MLLILSVVTLLLLLFVSALVVFRFGWKPVPVLVILIAVSILFSDFQEGFIQTVTAPVLIGAAAGATIRGGRSLQFFIILAAVSLGLLFTSNYYTLKVFKKTDLLLKSKEQVVQMIRQSDMPEKDRGELLKRIEESFGIIPDIIPFMYFLNALFFSIVSFMFISRLFNRFIQTGTEKTKGLEFFRLNDYLIFGLIFGWLIVLLVDRTSFPELYLTGLNGALIISLLYLVQAIGVFKFFLIRWGTPLFIIPAALVFILLLGINIVLFFSIILTSVGALDFWADFRKLEKATTDPDNV